MLLTKLDKNIVQTTWRYLNTYVGPKNIQSTGLHSKLEHQSSLKFLRAIFSPSLHRRNYSTSTPSQDFLPPLSDSPKITWPSFFKSCGNFIRCNFVIKPYMDNDFNMPEFVEGSRQVI